MKRYIYMMLVIFAVMFLSTAMIGKTALAASNIFLCGEGLNGESMAMGMRGCSDVSSVTHAIERPSSSGITRERIPADFSDVNITKNFDKMSPVLRGYAATGGYINKLDIVITRSFDGRPLPYLVYKLEGVQVSKIDSSASSAGPIIESVSFSYKKILMEYSILDKTGKSMGKTPFIWDLEANKG